MTVSSETSKVAYLGDGNTILFAVPFYFLANSEVKVVHRNADGVEITWTEGTHYELAGAGSAEGGALTVKTTPIDHTPAAGERLTIKRDLNLVQETDYPEGGQFPARAHEQALDRIVMLCQQLKEEISRTPKLTESSTFLDLVLPDPEAGKGLVWNATADALENRTLIGSAALVSQALKLVRVKSDETDFEFRTATQVRSDIGAAAQSHSHTLADITDDGTMATQNADNVSITGGSVSGITDISLADGGTGASDAAGARTNLGLVAGGAGDIWIEKAGDMMTGALTLPADPTDALHAATKQYVDAAVVGVNKRGQVKVATTANVALSSTQAIDGIACVAGDIVLVKNQTASAENGVYVVAAGAWQRESHFDTFDEIAGSLVAIEQGVVNAETLWLCNANDGGVLGTDSLSWQSIYPGSGGTVTQVNTSGLATGGPFNASGTIDVAVATQAEAEAGAVNDKAMTPLRGQQQFTALNTYTNLPPRARTAVRLSLFNLTR